MKNLSLEKWHNYQTLELTKVKSALADLGYQLDEKQVHISGERHLQSGYKLVLLGKKNDDDTKVIIKVSSKNKGKDEIKHEHLARKTIDKVNFAYLFFPLPEEILYTEFDGFLILVTKFIKESLPFLKYSNVEQFFLSLKALETQEGAQITTASHLRKIDKVFGVKTAKDYLNNALSYTRDIIGKGGKGVDSDLINSANNFITSRQDILDIYGDFLTHSDFVPHNLRTVGYDIYLLDHTSVHFGNKYEGWARFLNYMVLYNKELESHLSLFVRDNRSRDEFESLKTMRLYKLLFLINFHVSCLASAEGDLLKLTKARIAFWQKLLSAVLNDKNIENSLINNYKKTRDSLRSESELERQRSLNQL